jgi:hypothetical protein
VVYAYDTLDGAYLRQRFRLFVFYRCCRYYDFACTTTAGIEFTKITGQLTLNQGEYGTYIPWGSIIYHWATGITEVYGPDNNRIFIAKDSAAAPITAPGGGGPATHIYQAPNGARIDCQATVGNDKATKIYSGDQLILTIIGKDFGFSILNMYR